MVKYAMRSVLVISAASLLFACEGGSETGGTPELKSTALEKVSMSLSMSLSMSPSQSVKCSDVATIAAGYVHTVGLKQDGTVVAVGDNSYGQLNVST